MIAVADAKPSAPAIQYTEFGIPIRNIWYMLLYAWKDLTIDRWRTAEIEQAPTLDALLAFILMKLVQQRLRIGLGCNYVDEERSLRGIRGHIDFVESLKRRSFERGQVHCEFDQYSANAPKNQIIRTTLTKLVQIGQFGPDRALADDLRHNLRRLIRTLDGIDLIELNLNLIRRQQLGRNDGDYRLMLSICELILERHFPTEQAGEHYLPGINRGALKLCEIYQQFVANFYRLHLATWRVSSQSHLSWHDKHQNPLMPLMIPDLVLEERASGRIIVLDTKFTAKNLVTGQFGKRAFDASHLYQVYAYLKTQEHRSEQYRRAAGILLYPAIENTFSERIELVNHFLRVECVDLAASWQTIEHQLLDLVSL